jgi:hypothetical protein
MDSYFLLEVFTCGTRSAFPTLDWFTSVSKRRKALHIGAHLEAVVFRWRCGEKDSEKGPEIVSGPSG